MRSSLALSMALLLIASAPSHADDTCNLDIRHGNWDFKNEKRSDRHWVEFNRTSPDVVGSRTVSKDEVIFSADFQRMHETSAMQAPNPFTFRSGWVLNSQFDFKQGQTFQVKNMFQVGQDEFYALKVPSSPHLTIFARPDGTLCNKVMNADENVGNVFLIKEYKSNPVTKLNAVMNTDARAPAKLRIIYLGSAGGIATFRTIWSRDGKILHNEDVQFDQTATNLAIAGLDIPVSDMTSDSVTVGEVPINDRIAWGTYWSALFRD